MNQQSFYLSSSDVKLPQLSLQIRVHLQLKKSLHQTVNSLSLGATDTQSHLKKKKKKNHILYLGNARLKLVWLFAIWLNYFRAGTEHGLCLKETNRLIIIKDYTVEKAHSKVKTVYWKLTTCGEKKIMR